MDPKTRREERPIVGWGEGVGGGERNRERESMHVWERERAWLFLLYVFFLPPGPVLCKLGLDRSAVLPEVLTPVLEPSFDGPVLFSRAFPLLVF